MKRPLQNILKKGKRQVKTTPQTAELLMLLSENNHHNIARLIQKWLATAPKSQHKYASK